ncbi:MAG: CCA tRNA nucleotidyltransferase [Leptolyngbyaceae bacterium]|nr:CCA tRNA nucleotidyltransferase [Leptolyngbyaceae bacterium]
MHLETLTPSHPLQASLPLAGPIFDPQQWPFALQWLPDSAYLVGGSVRDALLGRATDHIDLDFVLAEKAVETARAIAKHYRTGFVVLDAERHIARVVFDGATADFAQQVGDSLEEDLQRRDFRVNAIAYHPHTRQLIDPLNGYLDLKQGILRMVSATNLQDDPLRLLRAYRQSAQLGFTVDGETHAYIRQFAPLLHQIAPERVHAELSYLLTSATGSTMLTQAWVDGLLLPWLPHANTLGLERVRQIDHGLATICPNCPEFAAVASSWVTDQHRAAGAGRSWIKSAKLACLVSLKAKEAESQLWGLKCSRSEVQAVLTVLRWLPTLEGNTPIGKALRHHSLTSDHRAQFFFFRDIGAAFPAVALMALALDHSTDVILSLIQRFLDPENPIAHPNPIITGHALTQALQLKPGPIIGRLLEQLAIAHAEGAIATHDQALDYARHIIANLTPND